MKKAEKFYSRATRLLVTLMLVTFFATWCPTVCGADKADENDNEPAQTAIMPICYFIVATIIVAGGIYVAYKLYKCAEKLLYPKPPPPPPPPPPLTNSPPRTNKAMSMVISQSASLPVVSGPVDMEWIAVCDVSEDGWYDWEGNLYTWAFGGSITNMPIGTNTGWFQSSPDLNTWTNSPCSIIGYVSESLLGVGTNMVVVVYDSEGIPFATNWSTLTVLSNQTMNATLVASVSGVPVRRGTNAPPRKFFRTLVTP